MYDFEGDVDGGSPQHRGPGRLWTLLELPRWIGEYTASRIWEAVSSSSETGDGRPVLVIPGFSATDGTTARFRRHLRRHSFHVHGWGLGRNIGLTDRLVTGIAERFEAIRDRHQQPVSIVGWSFGGVVARSLAHRYPDDVRQVICLASPWRAEGERTRATRMFERSRAKHGISDRAKPLVDQLRGPVPVPTTAIWSKSDGIVPWQGCRVDEADLPAPTENIEVVASHVGMVSSPLVVAAVLDRLEQDPSAWQPFDWRQCLGKTFVPGPLRGVQA